ncbi:MAG: hypothetical protein ACFBSG_13235 [Leptolyngbyaceae cyanobacterium]
MVSRFITLSSWTLGWCLVAASLQPSSANAEDVKVAAMAQKYGAGDRSYTDRWSTAQGNPLEATDRRQGASQAPVSRTEQNLATQLGSPTSENDVSEPLATAAIPRTSLDTSTSRLANLGLESLAPPAAPELEFKLEPADKPQKSVIPLLDEFLAAPVTSSQSIALSPPTTTDDQPATPVSLDAPATTIGQDPELGVIEVSEVQRDDELGEIRLRHPLQDPELGIIELQQIAPPPRRRPFLFVSSYVSASSSDNIFLVEDPIQGRFGDNFIRPGISLTAFPAIGPDTNLLISATTNFLRYEEQSNSSYDEVRFRAGIRHRFSERAYGQFNLSQQLLFDEGYKDQFFTNTGFEITLGRRDPLTPRLILDSYYQGQVFFSNPEEFSNILNSVGAYLGYRISPQWDTGIGYRFTISDFTQQSRHEAYQRLTGQLRYSITPSVRLSIFGGLSAGRSSESRINFDDSFFGISFDATVSIF